MNDSQTPTEDQEVFAFLYLSWQGGSTFKPSEAKDFAVLLADGVGTNDVELIPRKGYDLTEIDFLRVLAPEVGAKCGTELPGRR